MKKIKRNGFFTFIFSFFPGLVEMYSGFMKSGVSIMGMFFLSLFVSYELRMESMLSISTLVWFFGFFHARNVACYSQSELEEKDDIYVWEEFVSGKYLRVSSQKMRKWVAIFLIIIGILAFWNIAMNLLLPFIPKYIWNMIMPILKAVPKVVFTVIIIGLGVKLIKGKKVENQDGR